MFQKILVPTSCWNELTSGLSDLNRHIDRIRLQKDKDEFLIVEDPTEDEKRIAVSLQNLSKRIFSKRELHDPEAFALSMALSREKYKYVLTDDMVAKRVLEVFQEERKMIQVLDSGDIFLRSEKDVINFIENFEIERKAKLSNLKKMEILDSWKKFQRDAKIE